MEIIEYIRKSGRRPKRNDDGHIIVKGSGAGRQKKGVLFAGIDPDDPNKAVIGFSMCSSLDEFDYINGQHEPGFGLDLAKVRSVKWSDYKDYFVQKSWTEVELEFEDGLFMWENPDTKAVVEIPPSVSRHLKKFIDRCRRCYKDKNFPEWVEKFERDESLVGLDKIRVVFDNELIIE